MLDENVLIPLEDEITVRAIDFSLIDYDRDPLPIRPQHHLTGRSKSTSRKQMRARARRKRKKAGESEEFKRLYKPIEQWDPEELARGRPRSRDGNFTGRPPRWITRAV